MQFDNEVYYLCEDKLIVAVYVQFEDFVHKMVERGDILKAMQFLVDVVKDKFHYFT